MKLKLLLSTFLLAGAAVLTTGAAPKKTAAATNWMQQVAVTPQGGHMLGNPDARVRLVEFASYTCPHCAAFEMEGDGLVKVGYVAPGRMSYEIRNFVRDPVDLAAAMMANCGDKAKFFGNHSAILRAQADWLATMRKASPVQRSRWTSGPVPARLRAVASDLKFYDLMQLRGYTRPVLDRCLADTALADRLAQQTASAQTDVGVQGTPSFMLDGILLAGTYDWQALAPQLAARF